MNQFFLILVLLSAYLIKEAQGTYLTYANGQIDPAIYSNKICVNTGGKSPRVENIAFGGSFPKKPLFIAYIKKFDMQVGALLDFTYNVTQLSETNAQVTITCPRTAKAVHALSYYWLAFYDPRITLIDSGIINVAGITSQTLSYTYPSNLHATQGFINFQSWGFNGGLEYSLEVQTVTSTQVDILFTSKTSYLTQIAFQVVIGPDDAFTIVDKSSGSITSSTAYSSTLAKVDNHLLLAPGYGYLWTTNTINVYLLQLALTAQTSTTMKVEFSVWGASTIDKVRYKEVQFNLKNYNVYYPFVCSKMRVVKKQVLSVQPLKLYINEQSKTYLSGDSYTWQLDPGVQTLNIIASLKCPQRYKLVGYVLKCTNCIKDTYDLSTDCFGGAIDYVEHRIKLKQQDYVYQQLQIEVTDTSITITQLTLNPKSVILSLELIRK